MTVLSVVIPTRGRARLLRHALHSVLVEDAPEVEIIVSDNSLDDETQALIATMDDPRLRYVRTGEDLDVYQSWNFALRQCKGRYSFLLADDDSLLDGGLRLILDTLEAEGWPDYLGLASAWYSGANRRIMPRNAMRFDLEWTLEGPADPRKMLNEFCCFGRPSFSPTYIVVKHHVREELWRRGVEPYLPAYPDFAFNALALALSKSAHVMRVPSLLHGYAPESLGENAFGPRDKLEWAPPAGEEVLFRLSLLKGYYFINGWMETVLRCHEALPDMLEGISIPWAGFLNQYCHQMYAEGHWRDVTLDVNAYAQFVHSLPQQVRREVLLDIGPIFKKLQRVLETEVWRHNQGQSDAWWDGRKFGFENITQCAAVAGPLYERAWRSAQLQKYILSGQQPGASQ